MKAVDAGLWVLVVSSALAINAAGAPLSSPGILVTGSGSNFFKVCSTCPNVGGTDGGSDGGDFVGAAETTGANPTFYNWLAEGVLVGPNSLPVLKARAEAMNPLLTDPSLGIGTTNATATAQGLQEYHYAGTEDGSYTITFDVNGVLIGDGETIDAGLTVFGSDYDPFLEGEFQITRIASGRVTRSASSTNGAFSESREVTFEIPAGEDFFVLAFLTGNAFFADNGSGSGGSLDGVADASHTFNASFTAGDTSLLTTVPEPAVSGLLLAGLGLVGCAARGRRHQSRVLRGCARGRQGRFM
jgi:PEP-CTERM motif